MNCPMLYNTQSSYKHTQKTTKFNKFRKENTQKFHKLDNMQNKIKNITIKNTKRLK